MPPNSQMVDSKLAHGWKGKPIPLSEKPFINTGRNDATSYRFDGIALCHCSESNCTPERAKLRVHRKPVPVRDLAAIRPLCDFTETRFLVPVAPNGGLLERGPGCHHLHHRLANVTGQSNANAAKMPRVGRCYGVAPRETLTPQTQMNPPSCRLCFNALGQPHRCSMPWKQLAPSSVTVLKRRLLATPLGC